MKERLVAEIDGKVKKRAMIYAVMNNTNLTEITEKALVSYLDDQEKSEEDKQEEENITIN